MGHQVSPAAFTVGQSPARVQLRTYDDADMARWRHEPLAMPVEQRQFVTRQELLAAGHADRDITRLVRSGAMVRIRRNAYVDGSIWSAADGLSRHRIRCLAVLASIGPDVVLSHVSATLFHGIDLWGVDLSRVHVTRLDGDAGRIERDLVHHEGFCLDDDLVEVGGIWMVRPARAVLEAASRATPEAALALFDSGLRAGSLTRDELEAAYELQRHWPFTHHLEKPLRMADGRSGSVGESRARWLFDQWHLPVPVLQFEVRRADGSLAGVTDFAWPERGDRGVLSEFDGRVKYGSCSSRARAPATSSSPRSSARTRSAISRECVSCARSGLNSRPSPRSVSAWNGAGPDRLTGHRAEPRASLGCLFIKVCGRIHAPPVELHPGCADAATYLMNRRARPQASADSRSARRAARSAVIPSQSRAAPISRSTTISTVCAM